LLRPKASAAVPEETVASVNDAVEFANSIGYPLVMKVVGPVHKSDVGGVVLNVKDEETVKKEFERLMQIKDATGVLIQPMLKGTELFMGAKKEDNYGHLIMAGMGGIFVEELKDVSVGLAPLTMFEANEMINNLKSKKIFDGIRGQAPINKELFAEFIVRLSLLTKVAPEIFEMDINPLLADGSKIIAVDARIRIEK
jgi:acetyltransferase